MALESSRTKPVIPGSSAHTTTGAARWIVLDSAGVGVPGCISTRSGTSLGKGATATPTDTAAGSVPAHPSREAP